MAINPPVDATQTKAWAALQDHFQSLQDEGIDLRAWFANDPQRTEKLSFEPGTSTSIFPRT